MDGQIEGRMDKSTDGQMYGWTERWTHSKTKFKLFCLFLGKKGWGVVPTPWLLWSALKIEVCFSIIKISHNPVEGGWGLLKKSSSRPN